MNNHRKIIVPVTGPVDVALHNTQNLIRYLSKDIWGIKIDTTRVSEFFKHEFDVIDECKAHGLKVFLDERIYDTPARCANKVKSLVSQGADIISLQLFAPKEMLYSAVSVKGDSLLLGVIDLRHTHATLQEEVHGDTHKDRVINLVITSSQAFLDGTISSIQDLAYFKGSTLCDNDTAVRCISHATLRQSTDLEENCSLLTEIRPHLDGSELIVVPLLKKSAMKPDKIVCSIEKANTILEAIPSK